MVSIGRGIIAEPELLVVDEPSLGLSPLFVPENFELIRRINSSGVTILLVEQNVNQTLAISHYGYVLSQGKIAVEGKAADLLADGRSEGPTSGPLIKAGPLGKSAGSAVHCAKSKAC